MRRTLIALAIAALVVPAIAQAQDYGPAYGEEEVTPHRMGRSIGIMGDVGVGHYNRHLAHETNTGVGYGAMVDLSPQRNIGLELGYDGGVNDFASKFSSDGRLVTNEVGGDLRVNIVPSTYALPLDLKPFLFGGAFYHRIDTRGFTPGVKSATNAFALPVGAGIEADLGKRFLIGARYTYNFLFNEINQLGGRSDYWTATVDLGARLRP